MHIELRAPNIVNFSHFKPVYVESTKTTRLHITNGMSVWIKNIKQRTQNASYEPLQVPRTVATLGAYKEYDGASLRNVLCYF